MKLQQLVSANKTLKQQNADLQQELHRYQQSLWSVLNILDPDQRDIIKNDLIHIELNQISDA